jgi:hypothetical protein
VKASDQDIKALFDRMNQHVERGGDIPFGVFGMLPGHVPEIVDGLAGPVACSDLEVVLFPDSPGRMAFFCNRIGCLCTPCRDDMEGEYPEYCPELCEMYGVDVDDEDMELLYDGDDFGDY